MAKKFLEITIPDSLSFCVTCNIAYHDKHDDGECIECGSCENQVRYFLKDEEDECEDCFHYEDEDEDEDDIEEEDEDETFYEKPKKVKKSKKKK